ncbi:hypothetical protein [Microbispora sp. KK1-11]|uniref:hypothetical protein n=1 Tax=Microbispora sp. KK1-11 TaxID=2053005 RepID=UPI00115C338D|nr:hypothetical protein [Microbispora sp. KK1-11]TQS28011.1 hypothetical protein FLW16_16425 [Microbispora sp. KK1-11]
MLSTWALETFGPRAEQIRQGVAEALALALENAQDAQKTARTELLHPFGFTLMSRKFEALAATFADMPDVETVKPPGSQHELVVLGGNLLFPFRYAKDRSVSVVNARIGDGRPSGLVQALFTRFGPRPWAEQLALGGVEAALPEPATPAARALTRLPEGTRLVLIAYACNARAGLLDVWWGEAELLDRTGSLRWHHCEPIPLAGQAPAAELPGVATPVGEASAFARGAMPAPALNPRPPYERATALPPMSEAPYAPDAAADEGR